MNIVIQHKIMVPIWNEIRDDITQNEVEIKFDRGYTRGKFHR